MVKAHTANSVALCYAVSLGKRNKTMLGHDQFLKILVLAGMLICGTATALTQVELRNQIQDLPPDAAIEHLYTLQDELRNWPPGEQIDYYQLLSQLQRKAPERNRVNLNWLLVFMLGAATGALIAFTRKPQMPQFSIAQADPLTSLYNHSTIFDIGKSLFRSAITEGRNLSTIVFELDDLDQIKQQQGNTAADQLLQLAALNARQVLRGNDCIGRMGQEQFLVILPNTGISQAREVAERIQSRLAEHPLTLDECPVLVTIGLGIAAHLGVKDSFNAMAKRAGAARESAQKQGSNQIVIAD